MGRLLVLGGAGLGALALSLWIVLVVSMRTGYDPVLSAIRRFNRRVTNRRVMKTAGQPGAPSIVRHVGRSTATPYETPVEVIDTDSGYLIALPYGTSPDWLKNVRAAGSAVLVHEGHTIAVRDPELVPAEELGHVISAWDRFVQRLYGLGLYLRLSRDDARMGAHG